MTDQNEAPVNENSQETPPPSEAAAPPPPTDAGLEMNPDARKWAMFCHLGGFAGFLIPFGGIIGPLVLWQIKKQEMPFVDEQGKEALNFQLTMAIYGIITGFLCLLFIGFLLLPVLLIATIVFMIVGALKANEGQHFQYPNFLCFRMVK